MFNASDIKELREKTGAGMLDCKKALVENNGEIEAAIDWLREKGIAKAAKKEGRIAAEGICSIKESSNDCVILEVNTETDNEPIGIVLGAYKDRIMVEYAMDNISNQLFVSIYQLYLPLKEDLEKELIRLLENNG